MGSNTLFTIIDTPSIEVKYVGGKENK